MVTYAVSNKSDHIFDPAHGMGAFFTAAKRLEKTLKREISLFGSDIDSELIDQIKEAEILDPKDLKNLQTKDFVEIALEKKYKSIVVNPPYIRHHRISQDKKQTLKSLAQKHLGYELDGRAGLHIYFLILSLLSLEKGGRLSFIVSSDICEGVFANDLWQWITKHYRIDAVLTFTGNATPFPGVDTNAIIFFIENSKPKATFSWAKCLVEDRAELLKWVRTNFDINKTNPEKMLSFERSLKEGLKTGFSRLPQTEEHKYTLADFAVAMRGIATGNNDFFLLDLKTVEQFNIPEEYLVPTIGRTRDLVGNVIDEKTLQALDAKGRPRYLLYIDTDNIADLPRSVRNYLEHGEEKGVNKTSLVAARRTWFKMEKRNPPPILFSYLGRRSSRFIHNKAQVLPLNGFLCIYPKNNSKAYIAKLIELLNQEEILKNLFLVGKSYGSDAVKVEPRAIERLPIPERLVQQVGLIP